MNIKPATEKDIKFIQDLQFRVGPWNSGTVPTWDDDELPEMFKDKLCFVAYDGNKPVGFIIGAKLRPFGAMLWNAAVEPEYQNRFVGPKLIKHFEDAAKAAGILWIVSYSKHDFGNQDIIERGGRKYYIGGKFTEVITIL